ncbi:MAG TPA: hypothetical protein VGX91_05065 [Candidatus Cybelea sp.]|nr:hypothetical protein [Candidatus Cybelea sp.]
MQRVIVSLPLIAAALLAGTAPTAADSPSLLDRMSALNPGLHAFTATMHAHVTMASFPFLSANLEGTYYYKAPDRNKVVFASGVPMMAQQFDKLYAHIEPPSAWRRVYAVTLVSDNGTSATFRLVPLKHGNVDHVEATADDRSATVTHMRWDYANGGYAEMTNHYGRNGGYLVVQSQNGHVQEPGYVADVSSTLDGYKLNPTLSDDLFTSE